MAWLEGLSTLKGQITNFTKEVLSEGRDEVYDASSDLTESKKKVEELEALCASQDLEITELRQRNAELQRRLGTTDVEDVALLDTTEQNLDPISTNAASLQNEDLLGTLEAIRKDLAEKERLVHLFEEQQRSALAEKQKMNTRCLQLEEQVKKLSKQLQKDEEERSASQFNEVEQLRGQLKVASEQLAQARDENSSVLKDQLKMAELRIEDLEKELQKVHQQMLDQLSDTQMNTSEIRGEIEQTRWQLLQESGTQKTELLRAHQDMVNRMIQMGEKNREVELNMKKLQLDGKHLNADIMSIIHKLGDPEQQELIHGALKALELENQVLKLRNARLELAGNPDMLKGSGLEPSIKSGDTENRCVGGSAGVNSKYVDSSSSKPDDDAESLKSEVSELSQLKQKLDCQVSRLQTQVETYERDIECYEMMKSEWSLEKKMMEQHLSELKEQLKDREEKLSLITAHKGLLEVKKQAPASDSDGAWQKRLQDINTQLSRLQKEKDELQQGKVCLSSEVEAMAKIIQDLESQLARAQEENAGLTSSLEELDTQHQDAIDQLLKVKQSLQKQNEALQTKVAVYEQKLGKEKTSVGVECSLSAQSCKPTQTDQLDDKELHLNCRRNLEAEFQKSISKLITFDIPKDYYSSSNDDKDSVGTLRTVEALVKMCIECKWKKDTLERKVAELMKELRDKKQEYEQRNKTAIELEKECRSLKVNVETLIEELMVSKSGGGEALAPIPENSEEAEAMEQRIVTLENEVEILREARSNLEADAKRLREEEETLLKKLQTTTAALRNQENLETEVRKLQEALTSTSEQLTKTSAAKSLLEDEMKRLQTEATQSHTDTLAADEHTQELLAGQNVLENEVRRLEDEVAKWQAAAAASEEQLKELKADKTTLQEEVELLQDKMTMMDNLLKERDSLLIRTEDLKEKVRQSDETTDSLKRELELLQEKCSSYEQQVGGLEEELQVCQHSKKVLEETCRSLELSQAAAVDDAQRDVLNKSKQLDEMQYMISEYENRCRQLEEVQLAYIQDLNSLKMELSGKETQLREALELKSITETKLHSFENVAKELSEIKEEKLQTEGKFRQLLNTNVELQKKCEELEMQIVVKNNEINSLNKEEQEAAIAEVTSAKQEISKWKEMAEASERQLNEAMKIRSELEQECGRLYRIESRVQNQEHVEREIERLKDLSEEMEERCNELLADKTRLEQQCDLLKSQLQNVQETEQESRERAGRTEQQLKDALQTKAELEVRCEILPTLEDKCRSLEEDVSRKQELIVTLRQELDEVASSKSELEAECKRLLAVEGKLRNQEKLEEEVKELKENIASLEQKLNEAQKDATYRVLENETSIEKRENAGELVNEIQILQNEKEKILCVLDDKTRENSTLKSDNNRLLQIISEQKSAVMKLEEERQFHSNEANQMAKETVANLSKIIKDKDMEIDALKQKAESLLTVLQGVSTNGIPTDDREMLNKELAKLNEERAELIKTVHVKHQESVQYHNEIQRLTGLLNQELNRSEEMKRDHANLLQHYEEKQTLTQNELLITRQRLQQLELERGWKMVTGDRDGPDAETIQRTAEVVSLQELQEKQKEIESLRSQVVALQQQLHETSQLVSQRDSPVSLKEGNDEVLLPEDIRVQVEALQSECARMADTLLQEQTRNKYLQNEVQEQYEKESVLIKELERLRQHLVEVEDGYTQEALRAEEQVKDLQSKLAQAEERIKNSSTAYTSASIRANQHVESLQGQARLIAQQRDDIQQKLSAAEDQVQHHAAALRNLQIVLEQFQKDKEREIGAATERLQHQLQLEKRRQEDLLSEISALQVQQAEAKEGLSAAARLGEQLDKKTETIASLKEEVAKLSGQLQEMESKVQSASLSVEGKVDRYLVKNLVLGYFMATQNTRSQVLRIVATVLDFNQEERERVGLDSAGSSSSGWFKSLMQPGKGSANTQSLSEAFIRFLENESRPQPQLRLLPEIPEAQEESRSDTPNSSASGSQRRSPLLLSEVHLPTFTQFPVGRNSSSILKDVLKDS